jgi:hypothetical protein
VLAAHSCRPHEAIGKGAVSANDLGAELFDTPMPSCDVCGSGLEPEPIALKFDEGMRLAWVCATHGPVSIEDPF